MEKKQLFMALVCATTMIFTGCKDDEVPAYEFKQQGSVKGTITGTTVDNTALNETFNFTSYNPSNPSSYYTVDPISQDMDFTILRGEPNSRGVFLVTFTIPKNSTSATSIDGEIHYSKETDKIIVFEMEDKDGITDDNNTLTFSDFSFDSNSGRVKTKYTLTGPGNSTGKTATVAGDIDVVVKKLVQ